MKRLVILVACAIALLIIGGIIFIKPIAQSSSNTKLQVVVTENFWGSLARQIGGNKADVISIVNDPNADPHEYESNTKDAREVSSADYVIINGAGYDSWANKLLNAAPSSSRKLLDVQKFLGQPLTTNPHFWYSPSYVNQVTTRITSDYCQIDQKDCSYYQNNYRTLNSSLAGYQDQIKQIAARYSGVKVAATEDIFAYLAKPAGLDLVSPSGFTQAVSEGNDPPAGSIALFEQQLRSGDVKLLVYNQQTITPLTTSIMQIAKVRHIPIVAITETIQPVNLSYQTWMSNQVNELSRGLQK